MPENMSLHYFGRLQKKTASGMPPSVTNIAKKRTGKAAIAHTGEMWIALQLFSVLLKKCDYVTYRFAILITVFFFFVVLEVVCCFYSNIKHLLMLIELTCQSYVCVYTMCSIQYIHVVNHRVP